MKAAKAAGDLSHSFPPRCAKVRVSTVSSAWASLVIRTGSRAPTGCKPFAANGISLFHKRHHHWRFVTAGSSFDTCPPEHVPAKVARDLKVC